MSEEIDPLQKLKELEKKFSKTTSALTKKVNTLERDFHEYQKTIEQRFDNLQNGQFADTELILKSLIVLKRQKSRFLRKLEPVSQNNLPVSKIHGHHMMIEIILSDYIHFPKLLNFSNRKILEIGTIRENLWSQSSTSRLACLSRMLDMRLTSVDMDPDNARTAEKICASHRGYIDFVTMRGEKYLAQLQGKTPHYIYIDAYDFDHPNHSNHRQSRYTQILGAEINDEACWKMHLDCAVELVKKLPLEGTIVIDDVWYKKGEWFGKGRTAIPHLLENEFSLVGQTWSTAAFRRL